MVIAGGYSWYGGTWDGAGSMQVGEPGTTGAVLTIANGQSENDAILGRDLINYATVIWDRDTDIQSSKEIENNAGALFDVYAGNRMKDNGGRFTNRNLAKLRKIGSNKATIDVLIRNSGIIENQGWFNITKKLAMNGGQVNDAVAARLELGDGCDQVAGIFSVMGTLVSAGILDVSGGTFTANATGLVGPTIIIQSGATDPGDFVVEGTGLASITATTMTIANQLLVDAGGELELFTEDYTTAASVQINQGGYLWVEKGGTFYANQFVNSGTIQLGEASSYLLAGYLTLFDSSGGSGAGFTQTPTGDLQIYVYQSQVNSTLNVYGSAALQGQIELLAGENYNRNYLANKFDVVQANSLGDAAGWIPPPPPDNQPPPPYPREGWVKHYDQITGRWHIVWDVRYIYGP